jgi:hypothetical protein
MPLQPSVERSPTNPGSRRDLGVRDFGYVLSPVNYRRRTARLVSYYALFKWWLLLSQHPSCQCNSTSFGT